MARTTPPRPFDIAEVFPELHKHRGTTTRLHPRTGTPTIADSSIGGPLLWPADEPWPMCTDGDEHDVDTLLRPAVVRRSREIRAKANASSWSALTDEERAELPETRFSEPEELIHQPVPLIPVAQLYRRDIPDFIGPDDTDLLQVLWCPLGHVDEDQAPRLRLVWRRTAEIGRPLPAAPEPAVVEEDYLPNPCVVHPEQFVDHRYHEVLPKDLQARIDAWEKETDGPGYSVWSVVPGWKVGGFPSWRMTGPGTMTCETCDTEMNLLFTVGWGEWDEAGHWRPIEDPADLADPLTDIVIGRGFDWYVFYCPVSFDHPHATVMP
ncbi:hypothetical protein [Actinoplanes regularis]|uniref:DUF1963 domain-containing protein n=1 Tax=Actinoplanes regularis TaxID=52697 RepID=A0A239F7T9_9ACTN|nr:hypothetical protein [Actinoplanes regularis]GIE90014.1 hypothetical protein Are01nite_64940 [Actinoplanes regularis]SNS52821.1 hypothetical protein SAMN06264365_117125 [Actinoplanes regularis]